MAAAAGREATASRLARSPQYRKYKLALYATARLAENEAKMLIARNREASSGAKASGVRREVKASRAIGFSASAASASCCCAWRPEVAAQSSKPGVIHIGQTPILNVGLVFASSRLTLAREM